MVVNKPTSRRNGQPTELALKVLDYMRQFFAENDQLPPANFISDHFGWASVNSSYVHIKALQRHGLVERNACGKLRFARVDAPASTTAYE